MDDADLEKLNVKPGKLNPKFNRNITEYEVVLNSGVKIIKVDPLTRDPSASWTILGSGTERSVTVTEGTNTSLIIEVTAEDGTTKQYTIKLVPLSSSSTVLSSIKIKDYQISPEFITNLYEYECLVPFYCMFVVVQTSSPDKNTKIAVADADDNYSVKLNIGLTKIQVKVTSPDETSTVSYCVNVRRGKFMFPVNILNYVCSICACTLYCPVSVLNDKSGALFCEHCLKTVTRSNKIHPLTGELLGEDFIVFQEDVEKKLSNEVVRCPFECGESLTFCEVGEHVKFRCDSSFLFVEKVDAVIFGNARRENAMHETDTCSSCSRAVPQFDKEFHQQHMCTSKHSYNFSGNVAKHKWECKYQQEVVAQQIDEPLKIGMQCEVDYLKLVEKGVNEYNQSEIMSQLNKACQLYAHGILVNSKDHFAHFRLAVVLEELYHLQDIFGIKDKDSREIHTDDSGEFQTAESMEDDIKALADLKGFGKDASITDQLKALDEEYHFLLERGQSEKADYLQKLYAFKQKQQHENKKTSTIPGSMETFLDKALTKYLDATYVQPDHALYQMHAGRCLLRLRKYDNAVERLKYAVALKPACAEAKFYLGCAILKSGTSTDYVMPYLQQGVAYYVHHFQWHDNQKRKMFAEDFCSAYSSLPLQGVHELSKVQSADACLLKKDKLLLLVSTLCFHTMNRLVNRGKLFKFLQSTALESQYDYGKYLINQKDADKMKMKEYWERVSNITMTFCGHADAVVLQIQRKICEAAVILLPNSSRALHHLGDVLLAILEKSPSSASVEDVEKYFRASIDEEGKDMNREEPSEFLKQTDFWRSYKKQCTSFQSSVVEKTAIASGVKKDEPPKGRGKAAPASTAKKVVATRSKPRPKTTTTARTQPSTTAAAGKKSTPLSPVKNSSTGKSMVTHSPQRVAIMDSG
ncbi:uncharacterized protein LOC130657999 isoform X2 [Hydractinia symbiolongicarpus]|uniref:uncharacterized protein LOC130657999 isoform X2 n=1 Tax=Hydractinia symbiolongicarpus TaxID=13093 RepID=UPI00254F6664|nr:uncharacterized protein LOC130657999 isoform X2 [Hydractinia symbiolongicarpus]